MSEQWELQRLGILKRDSCFQIVSPSGGFYEVDKYLVELLLQMHGKSVGSSIRGFADEDVREFSNFAEREFLLLRKASTDHIESPFNIERVMDNLKNSSIKMLTLGDLVLQITNNCNYCCKGCSTNALFQEKTEMVDVNFEQIIRDASRFGCLSLGLTGGEPLLPCVIDKTCHLAYSAKGCGFQKIVIATNGFYVKQSIRDLKEAGVTRLSISFHGLDGYMERYTGCSQASTKSKEAILSCLEEGLHLGINCVVTKQNLSQMNEIVKKLYPIIRNVSHAYIRFSPLIEIGRANTNQKFLLDVNDMSMLLTNISKYKELYGEKVRLTCDEEYDPDDPMICDAGLMYAMTNVRGNVSACDILDGCCPIGEVKNESFFNIWNDNERWHEFRQLSPINSTCRSCPMNKSKVCFGRCKALSYLKFGSLSMSQLPDERRCLK